MCISAAFVEFLTIQIRLSLEASNVICLVTGHILHIFNSLVSTFPDTYCSIENDEHQRQALGKLQF